MRGPIARLFVVVALAILSLALAAPAMAQYPPTDGGETTPDASFGCEGLTGGGTATCSIGGFQADSEATVEVTDDTTVVYSDAVTADDVGFLSYSFEVPADADELQFAHFGVAPDGSPIAHTAVLDATAPAAGTDEEPATTGGLPSTGEMVSLLLVAAVLALAIGTVAVRRGRTRVDA